MVITTTALTAIRSDIKTYLQSIMTHGSIGMDSTTPVVGDTALGQEVFRDVRDDWDVSAADTVVASVRILTTEANTGNAIVESGWLDAASYCVDDCDTADWDDSADMTTVVNTDTYVEGEKSLNLTKDAGASATASTSKTTTSRDFTGETLYVWIYVKDTTAYGKLATSNCLTIRFGSGAGNYFQWQKDKADLAVGWNYIGGLTSANGAETGTVVLTACDYTYVALTATGAAITWSAGDFIMDNITLISGTLYTHNTLTSITKTDDIQLYLDTSIKVEVTES